MNAFSCESLCWRSLIFMLSFTMFNNGGNCQVELYTQDIPGTNASIPMIWIPEGSFNTEDSESSLMVNLEGFWMSQHEITYDQYQPFRDKERDGNESALSDNYNVDAVTRPTPPYLDFTNGMGSAGGYPAVSMTQQAALRYCLWLYEKTGIFYRLPTDLEWEYACLGGSKSESTEINEVAWHWDNSSEKYHQVGQKKQNGYGLHDMLGNVSEYTIDQFREKGYSKVQLAEPHKIHSTIAGKYGRSVRGGAYDDSPEDCSCTTRIPSNPKWQARDPQVPKSIWWNPDSPFVGFRIVRPQGEFSDDYIRSYFKKVIID